MPDDLMRGFDFVQEHSTRKSLADQIAEEMVQYSILDHLKAKANDTKQTQNQTEPDWDGNVPPDFTDSFDFLL